MKRFQDLSSLVFPALAAERRNLLVLAGWSLLEATPVLLSGQLVAQAVDKGFLGGDVTVGIGLLGVYAVLMVAGAFATRQALMPLASIVEAIRDHVVRRVVTASLHNAVHGAVTPDAAMVSRITRQAELIRQFSNMLLTVARTVVFSAVGTLAGLFTLLPQVAVLTTITLAASGVLLALLSRVLQRRYLAAMVAEEELSAAAGRTFSGLRDIRACGASELAAVQLGHAVDAQAATTVATARAGTGRIGVIVVGGRLPLLITLVLAAGMVRSGEATTGAILGACTYLVVGLEPLLRQVVQAIGNMGLHFFVTLHRLAEHATCAEIASDGTAHGDGYDLTLREVTFAYGPHSTPVLTRTSLVIEHGVHLAVLGPSGVGKSTLANLIAGLEAPQHGEILLGGTPLARLDRKWLHQAVALVPQEHFVFNGTVRENLAYLVPTATDTELDTAVDLLGLRPTVTRLGGYDAELFNADTLSQGERQLITLVRIYLSAARIVVLDEATCHLDPQAEARVETAFRERGGTLIVIAHRISSARRAQRIVVLDGTGLRSGTHETLLDTSPLYGDLVAGWTADVSPVG
ncbi:ATP-binding cassette, subfamily C [Amycolatopsis xylanica]|uniref:ATP-binding cassette, subfamily C n=1 Tax=Amycolatopsis xylanica TaxID=589385 RepID=A0A1H3GGT4_9PSEU|nr:ABC transporter ATP-binding protein [Amycolatopsis xylanica]SDY01858.1 ATP-binding cassette, subfamily C [Amycolatopsis xylanica]